MPRIFHRERHRLEIMRAEIAALTEGEPTQIPAETGVIGRNPDSNGVIVCLGRTKISDEQSTDLAFGGDIHSSEPHQAAIRISAIGLVVIKDAAIAAGLDDAPPGRVRAEGAA